eukprot:GHVL01024094.1.p1 GENE.GHVL01024094.1~~GHVL01024094.1.p1  ORF type:complete len:274 (+),score=31.47 GHVL01024094.1:275-1096(+)
MLKDVEIQLESVPVECRQWRNASTVNDFFNYGLNEASFIRLLKRNIVTRFDKANRKQVEVISSGGDEYTRLSTPSVISPCSQNNVASSPHPSATSRQDVTLMVGDDQRYVDSGSCGYPMSPSQMKRQPPRPSSDNGNTMMRSQNESYRMPTSNGILSERRNLYSSAIADAITERQTAVYRGCEEIDNLGPEGRNFGGGWRPEGNMRQGQGRLCQKNMPSSNGRNQWNKGYGGREYGDDYEDSSVRAHHASQRDDNWRLRQQMPTRRRYSKPRV